MSNQAEGQCFLVSLKGGWWWIWWYKPIAPASGDEETGKSHKPKSGQAA